jgi:hypothetical protein
MGLPSAPPPAEFSADHTAQARRCRTRGARPCPRLREYARLKGTPNQRRQGHRRLSLAADASVLRLKFNWLFLPVYELGRSELGEVAGERVQDFIGGLGPGERPGVALSAKLS